jgi:predicted XRE-type DNA-binding protein
MSDEDEVTTGSGNVFADLDLPDAEEVRARADLLRMINRILDHRHLTQAETATLSAPGSPPSLA